MTKKNIAIHYYKTKLAHPIPYKDGFIWRATRNASGIKYYAYTKNGIVRSDTLVGIKSLILSNN